MITCEDSVSKTAIEWSQDYTSHWVGRNEIYTCIYICVCLFIHVCICNTISEYFCTNTNQTPNKQTNNKQTDRQTKNKVKSHMIWTHRNLKNLKNTIAVYRTRSNKGLQNWQNCNLGDPQYAVKIPKGTYVFSEIYLDSQKKTKQKMNWNWLKVHRGQ